METLFALPASSAPFCIAMKNGFVLVLVINVTAISSPSAGLSCEPAPPVSPPPQAAKASEAAAVNARAAARREPLRFGGKYFIDNPLRIRTADHDNGVKVLLKWFSALMSTPSSLTVSYLGTLLLGKGDIDVNTGYRIGSSSEGDHP